ncbi:NUDIX hydrolase [Polymorphobacter sp. PAMC 29334]|nr:NUDIX hydrolase [Polymorphobacter sp. PAMC 29334]
MTSGRPKDAATLLIVRRDDGAGGSGGEPRVLMGRRHGGHAFMPGKWVFPGGGIDRGDFAVPAATELVGHVAAALARTTTPARGRALAMAAIRETFEETGLLVAKPVDSAPVKRTGPWRDFFAAGVAPDLAALDFVARAITPPVRPRRFDARFFVADAAALVSLDPGGGSGELDELAWFDWDAAAALDLPQITRAILAEVKLRLRDPMRPIPCHRFVRGGHRLETV